MAPWVSCLTRSKFVFAKVKQCGRFLDSAGHHFDGAVVIDALALREVFLAHRVSEDRKTITGMEHSEDEDRQSDHTALEGNELRLVPHELIPPSASKLRDTVDASSED